MHQAQQHFNEVCPALLKQEEGLNLGTLQPYEEFQVRVFRHRDNLKELIEALVVSGKKIIGYGASTKGNVLLQVVILLQRLSILEGNNRKMVYRI